MNETRRLRRWIGGVGAGLIAAFVASSAWDAWRLHQQVTRSTGRELANLARALSEEAERSLQAVDLLLTDTALWYRDNAARLTPEQIETALKARASATPQVSVLTLADADGRQRWRSRATGEPLADVSDRAYFRAQRDSADIGLFINPPIVTRTERREALVVSRRLETREGAFAGVVTAIVTLQELREVYDAIDLGTHSALLLTFDDGTLVVRQPPDPRGPAQVFTDLTSRMPSTPRLAVSPADGREKYIVSVPVSDRPLMMSVTRDHWEAMAPWRDEMTGLGIRTLALVAVGLLTISLMLRQLRRLEAGEAKLRVSEQRYALAMDAANEGHAEWRLDEGVLFSSERWRGLHGQAGQDGGEATQRVVASRTDTLLGLRHLHPDDLARGRAALDDHLAGRTPELDLEYRIGLHADAAPDDAGDWRWIHLRGRCQRDAAGRPTRFHCAASDITARKQAESEQERLQGQLRQARHMEALGTLAGGIAHDFNNILGAILGHGEMAQRRAARDGAPADPDLARHLDRVMQAGARARLLVRRILDFSRSGVRDRSPVNVDGAVEEAMLLVAPTVPDTVRLRTRLSADGAAVLGDALQIHQLVSNLCSNALGAMPRGGTLTVEVECVAPSQPQHLSHGLLAPGRYALISVADEGDGIPPTVYDRMFDPFFTTKAVGEGTGLGLSVVHSIVTDMGGAIHVVSTPGQGSRFTLWLPADGDAARVDGGGDGAELPRGDGQVILIVDDEAALVEFAEEMLAELGYEPVGFTDPRAALAAFTRDPERFDAALTDETMPGLSGVELSANLLRLRPTLPVLVMSGFGGEALEQRVLAAGARALVRKPLSATELATAVARVLVPAV